MTESQSTFSKIWKKLPLVGEKPPLVNLLDLHGVIAASSRGKSLSLKKLEKPIDKAFEGANLKAVGLVLNSPGGSPVQSRFIMKRIRDLAAEKKIPVLAFVEDIAASGGYILACAADEVFADESSIVGSIGVISAGFGFTDAIEKLGIDRRVYTAGKSKSQLDPFKPENPEQLENLQSILDALHQQFIKLVRDRRGSKLGGQDDIFTGQIFTAEHAMERGLIDGLGDYREICRNRFGEEVAFRRIPTEEKSLLSRFGLDAKMSIIDPETALEAAEAKAIWARYGM